MGDEGDEESAERAMMAAMGFASGFASTKVSFSMRLCLHLSSLSVLSCNSNQNTLIYVQGKFVDDPACHLGIARTKETRKYRQYMNRTSTQSVSIIFQFHACLPLPSVAF